MEVSEKSLEFSKLQNNNISTHVIFDDDKLISKVTTAIYEWAHTKL